MAPAELIREIAEFVRPEFKEISARVVVETPEGADDLRVRMDPARLKRAILNIIKNAREAMSNGGQLTLVSRRSSRRELQIDIRDTGHGIPNDELPGIFDIQYSKKTEGSGLGLAIVRQIIEEAGGSIRVRSEQGKGTTFAIRLPLCND
jgi:signal transduction histidine kinase